MQPGTTAGPRRRMIPAVAAILGLLGSVLVATAGSSAAQPAALVAPSAVANANFLKRIKPSRCPCEAQPNR